MTIRTRKNTRCIAALVAVAFAVGLTVPLLAAERSSESNSLGSVDPSTMDIFAGLNTAAGEGPASPYLPPGQGGTPPGKPEGPGSESRPPEFAQNDKEKEDKDKDKDEEEEENDD